MMGSMAVARFVVPADHPALPGHFPGRPVVPGVLLLDAVLQAACALGEAPKRILRAKFAAPVAPGAEVDIRFETRSNGRTGFNCRCGDTTVLLGEF
ncbi:MAG: fabA-like domain protein [Rubritepida sp.]|nr:fabA-like domain protein [Rubritepida sp.]